MTPAQIAEAQRLARISAAIRARWKSGGR